MKKIQYILWLLVIAFAGCKTDYDRVYDNNMEFYTFGSSLANQGSFSFSPNYEYEGRLNGVTFNMSVVAPALPNSLFDENGDVKGELEITPIYLGHREKSFKFNVSFNKAVVKNLEFRHAPGDQLRLLNGTEDEEKYTLLTYGPKYMGDFTSAAFVFQDMVLPEQGAYIHKAHRTGKLLIYMRKGKNEGRYNGKFDTEGVEPEMVIDNFTVAESGSNITWIRPIGSPVELWKEENAAQYTKLNARVVYGGGDVQNWLFTYNGDKMSRSTENYVRKDNLSGTLKVFRQNPAYNDFTFMKEVPGPFQENQIVEFLLEGGALVPNTYSGPNPSSTSHSFFRIGYKKNGGTVVAGAVKIRVYADYTDVMTGDSRRELLKEVEINQPAEGITNYAAPFEFDWMGQTSPGMPDPGWEIESYLPNFSCEVIDAVSGKLITRAANGFVYEENSQYLQPYRAYDMPTWPITPKYKQMNIIYDTGNNGISIAYGSGVF